MWINLYFKSLMILDFSKLHLTVVGRACNPNPESETGLVWLSIDQNPNPELDSGLLIDFLDYSSIRLIMVKRWAL